MKAYEELRTILTGKGLKVTPQRIGVLEALYELHHPSADELLGYIRKTFPGIATGTVYNILEQLANKGLIEKVKTDHDLMRYDAITEKHHHIYCSECDTIADYYDEKLNKLLEKYFTENQIQGFHIEDIRLQIVGKFDNHINKDNSLQIKH